jgi:hypothetical protein
MDDLPNSPPVRPIRSIQLLLGQMRYRGPHSVRNVSQLGHQRNSQFDVWRRPRFKRPNRIPQVKHDLFLIISLACKTGPPPRRTSWCLAPVNSRSVGQRRNRLKLNPSASGRSRLQAWSMFADSREGLKLEIAFVFEGGPFDNEYHLAWLGSNAPAAA